MNSDSYFAMGKSHIVCQDYAFAGTNRKNNAVGVISDGCSGSPDTDFGARFLVRSAVICAENIHGVGNKELFDKSIIRNAVGYASQFMTPLKLSSYSLDATLFYMQENEGYINVITAGDGILFAKTKEGRLNIWNIEYPNGCPFYPNYFNNEDRHACFKEGKNNDYLIHYHAFDENEVFSNETWSRYLPCFSLTFSKTGYEYVGVASDGLLTIDQPIEDTIKEITAFKSFKGEFVKRRVKRFLKECAKKDMSPTDDVSVAVIYTGN